MSLRVESAHEHGKEGEAEATGKGEESGGRKIREQKVPFFKLFTFADTWDVFLMAAGAVGACVHGASVPVFFIFFGKLINIIGIAYLFPTTVSDRVAKVSLLFFILGLRSHSYMLSI